MIARPMIFCVDIGCGRGFFLVVKHDTRTIEQTHTYNCTLPYVGGHGRANVLFVSYVYVCV